MASKNSSSAGLFSSLEPDDSFGQLTGPKLYTPLPVKTDAQMAQASPFLPHTSHSLPPSGYAVQQPSYQYQETTSHNLMSTPPMKQLNSETIKSIPQSTTGPNIVPMFSPQIGSTDSFLTGPMIQSAPPSQPYFSPNGSHSMQPIAPLHHNLTPQRPTQVVPPQPVTGPSTPPTSLNSTHLPVTPIPSHSQPQEFNSPPQQLLATPQRTGQILGNATQEQPNYNISPFPTSHVATNKIENVSSPQSFSPVVPHWFFCKDEIWKPFSFLDSNNIETAQQSAKTLSTDGGRFDVNLISMKRTAVYWDEAPSEVRRCTWFYKTDADNRFVPYDTTVAQRLEEKYMEMMKNGIFNIRVDVSPGVFVIFHNPNVLVQYTSSGVENMDWTGEDSKVRPKVVKRGIAELKEEIHQGEPTDVDHLVFVVHGIGPVADLRMRSIIECVGDFRRNSLDMMTTHPFERKGKTASRVEFIPIQWYSCLHADRHGIDRQLKSLSLPSISKLRNFTNETLTDILFFTSPMYCQTICDTVVSEMNRLYNLFKSRNPLYNGTVSVVGHSLGSCILFDILANQLNASNTSHVPMKQNETPTMYEDVGDVVEDVRTSNPYSSNASSSLSTNHVALSTNNGPLPDINTLLSKLNLSTLQNLFTEEQIDTETLVMCSEPDLRDLGVPFGPRKKLISYIKGLGKSDSPIGTSTPSNSSPRTLDLLTRGTQTAVKENENENELHAALSYTKTQTGTGTLSDDLLGKGVTSIGSKFELPNCPKFINIFHPYDPVVYRLEPLVNEQIDIPPVLIPHHKGRKRFHLEIKENLTRVGANLKSGLLDAVNRTWTSINDFARAHRASNESDAGAEVSYEDGTSSNTTQEQSSSGNTTLEEQQEIAYKEKLYDFGLLNKGERIDYVLQEKPFEILNEYLFALSSHTCYWTSEDTALLILKEVYKDKK